MITWHALDRERRKIVAGAARRNCHITVDGRPEPFTLLDTGTRWVAVRQGTELTITIAGKEIDPATLKLTPIADPEGELLAAQ